MTNVKYALRGHHGRANCTFVNYLFERGRHTVGEAIEPLRLSGVPRGVLQGPIREVRLEDAAQLSRLVGDAPARARQVIDAFEATLPAARRAALGDLSPPGRRPPRAAGA